MKSILNKIFQNRTDLGAFPGTRGSIRIKSVVAAADAAVYLEVEGNVNNATPVAVAREIVERSNK